MSFTAPVNREIAVSPFFDIRSKYTQLIKMNPIKHPELTFQLIVEAAPNAMLLVDNEGLIVLANLQAEKLFGYDREELLEQVVEVIIPPRYRHSHIGFRNMFSAMPMG